MTSSYVFFILFVDLRAPHVGALCNFLLYSVQADGVSGAPLLVLFPLLHNFFFV